MEIEQGTFTPLVFSTTGGMAEECRRYHSRLAELLAIKKGEDYSTAIAWVRTKVSFAILRTALLCVRGSRTLQRRNNLDMGDADLDIEKPKHEFISYFSFLIVGLSNLYFIFTLFFENNIV